MITQAEKDAAVAEARRVREQHEEERVARLAAPVSCEALDDLIDRRAAWKELAYAQDAAITHYRYGHIPSVELQVKIRQLKDQLNFDEQRTGAKT